MKILFSYLINFYILVSFTLLTSIKANKNTYFLSIDLGSEYIKAAVFDKKTGNVEMVENLQTKTKSSNIIALLDDERLFGHEALSKQLKYSDRCFVFMDDFIQKYTFNNNEDTESSQIINDENYIPYMLGNRYKFEKQSINKLTFDFQYNYQQHQLTIKGLIAMQLRFFKKLTEKYILKDLGVSEESLKEDNQNLIENVLKGLVLVLPDNLNHSQRIIFSEATELAKLNLLAIISPNDSSAFIYAKEIFREKKPAKESDEKLQEIIGMINIGSSYSLIGFYDFSMTFPKSINSKGELKIKSLNSEFQQFGGRNIDYLLLKYFEKNHPDSENQVKLNSSSNVTYEIKIHPALVKYKEILSANKDADYNIFGMKGKFERNKLENILSSSSSFNNLKEILNKTKNNTLNYIKQLKESDNDVEIADSKDINLTINSIELLGGTTRVPYVNKIISDVYDEELNKEKKEKDNKYLSIIGTRINGDDSPARGASFLALPIYETINSEDPKLKSKIKINLSPVKNYQFYVDVYSIDKEGLEMIKENDHYSKQKINSALNLNSTSLLLQDYLLIDSFFDINNLIKLNLSTIKSVLILLKEKNIQKNEEKASLIKFFITELEDLNNKLENISCDSKFLGLEFIVKFTGNIAISNAKYECGFNTFLNYTLNNYDEKSYNYTNLYSDPSKENRIKFEYSLSKVNKLSNQQIDSMIEILYPNINQEVLNKIENNGYDHSNLTENKTEDIERNNTQDTNSTISNFTNVLQENREMIINKTRNILNMVGNSRPNKQAFTGKVTDYDLNKKNQTLFDLDMKTLDKIDYIDSTREEKLAVRNELETKLYEVKEKLNEKSYEKYTTGEELNDFSSLVNKIANWFDEEGLSADFNSLSEKFNDLKNALSPIEMRFKLEKSLDIAIEELTVKIKKINSSIENTIREKPWIKYYIENNLISKIRETENFTKLIASEKSKMLINNNNENSKKNNSNEELFAKLTSWYEEKTEQIRSKKIQIENKLDYYMNIPKPKYLNPTTNIKYYELLKSKFSDPEDWEVNKLINFEE